MRWRFDPITGLARPVRDRVRNPERRTHEQLYMPGIISAARGARTGRTLGSVITGGVIFGDLTSNRANAFDGNTNQVSTSSAQKGTANIGFIGKTIQKRLFKFQFYGATNNGYASSKNPQVTLAVRAQVGGVAPNLAGASVNGVPLGTIGPFTDTADQSNDPREVISLDPETLFDHFWVYLSHNTGATNAINMTEFIPYEAI